MSKRAVAISDSILKVVGKIIDHGLRISHNEHAVNNDGNFPYNVPLIVFSTQNVGHKGRKMRCPAPALLTDLARSDQVRKSTVILSPFNAIVYAQHGRDLMGRKSLVCKPWYC